MSTMDDQRESSHGEDELSFIDLSRSGKRSKTAAGRATSNRGARVERASQGRKREVKHMYVDEEDATSTELDRLHSLVKNLKSALQSKDTLFTEMKALRHTDPETNLESLRRTADMRFEDCRNSLQSHVDEAAELRARNAALTQELAATRERLTQNGQELHDQAAPPRKADEKSSKSVISSHKEEIAALKQELEKERLLHEDDVRKLQKELDTECEYSKKLMAELKASKSQANPQTSHLSIARHTNNDDSLELGNLRLQLDLVGDLTGLMIRRTTEDAKGVTFDCLMTDVMGRQLALPFKLQLHEDDTCSYQPCLDEERDGATTKHLRKALKGYMRVHRPERGQLFAALFKSLNLST